MATGSKKVDEWLTDRYPDIRQQAEESNALIYFADESSVRSDYHSGTTWAKKGCTPIVEATGARFSINMISAVSAEGTMRYMTIPGRFNTDVFICFLKQLVTSHDRPIIVVTDGHPAHKAKKVQKYIEQEPRLLGVHILPAYSPELNPDESVWGYLKSGHLGRMTLRTKGQFLRAVRTCLKSLQRLPRKIQGFFRSEHTAYACLETFV
ncbi:IS630 family transposase [Endozoicomonas montiporae]|uniref:IS630 family transposase n=1 Tax=Endozoicomonas montiporae TaxID=1027273 RepID=UPI0022A8DF7F|nr:IS630 family transposase [Endozoicomonas montiporae]